MKRVLKQVLLGAAVAGMAAVSAPAQSLEQNLSQLSSRSAKLYVTPLASAFAANMNTGWYHRPPSPVKLGFHFEGGVMGMGAFLGGGARGFKVREPFSLSRDEARAIVNPYVDSAFSSWNPAQRARLKDSLANRLTLQESNVMTYGPTISGSRRDSVKVVFEGETIVLGSADPFPDATTSFTLPGGDTLAPGADRGTPVIGLLRSLQALPQFAPQVTLGTLYGTNLTVRWLPETQTIEEVGALEFFGFGVQHNPKAWLRRPLPVNLSVGYYMQWLSAADMMKASSWATSVHVSKVYGWRVVNVSPYAGLQAEGASIDFAYEQTLQRDDGTYSRIPVAFTVKGENIVRGTLGVNLRILAISLNADYSLSKYSTFSGGMMIGI
jgi:hypothetical protein